MYGVGPRRARQDCFFICAKSYTWILEDKPRYNFNIKKGKEMTEEEKKQLAEVIAFNKKLEEKKLAALAQEETKAEGEALRDTWYA